MKNVTAIFLVLCMLFLQVPAFAANTSPQIDYSALQDYTRSWNAALSKNGLALSFDAQERDGYIFFNGSFLSSQHTQNSILDSLSDPTIPSTLIMAYLSDRNTISLLYGRPDITEIPKEVEIYADGVQCSGDVVLYAAETQDETDLYALTFDLADIPTILNAQTAFIRLVTENETLFQEMDSETWTAPYLMWSIISNGIEYSDRTSKSYLDPSLLGQEATESPQPTTSDVQTSSFQTDYDAIDQAAQSVFLLEVYNDHNQLIATGSGFVAFDSSTLITNEHVIEDAAYIIAYSDQYKSSYKLQNLKIADKNKDIAILEFDADAEIKPLTVDMQSPLLRGQPVTAIGSPKGVLNTVSSGNISNIVYYSEEIPDYIQFTAPISPGSSGGALFNGNGDVVGLCVSFLKEGHAMYYAIPMKYVEELYLISRDKAAYPLAQYNHMVTSLSAPRLLMPNKEERGIELNWSAVSNAENYEVYRRDESSAEFSAITTTQETHFFDSDVVDGIKYEYYIIANCSGCSSSPSNTVTVGITRNENESKPSPTPTASPQGKIIYKNNDVNDEIISLKIQLYELGYYSAIYNFNGIYTLYLQSAVKSFQQKNQLSPTGMIDEETWQRLAEAKNEPNHVIQGPLTVPNEVVQFSGKTYQLNDKSAAVKSLKQRLQSLGYYRSSSEMDHTFNQTMVERVKQFQKNNHLKETGVIDYVTLIKLYSSEAVKGEWYNNPTPTPTPKKSSKPTPAPENAIALVIPDGSYGEWKYLSGNRLQFHLQVQNTSQTRTIEAYELYVYPEDVWGKRLIPDDEIYVISVNTKLAPGKKHYSSYITMDDAKQIDTVYVAVHRVKYTDGTIKTVTHHIYSSWDID